MRFASPETSAGGRFARTASRELNGARIVITGVLATHSIAFAVARAAQEAGAEIVLTSHGRARRITARAASRLPDEPEILELDVNSERDLDDLGDEVMRRW